MLKEVILILGMHRSGTSAVAGAFSKLGAKLPNDLMPARPSNPLGFFESNAVVALNDRILSSLGTNWRDWRRINPRWFETSAAQGFKEDATNILASDFEDNPLIVLKDPRICRLTPLWQSALTEVGFSIRVIIPFRNPLEVAESLQSRDGIPIPLGLLIWLRHVADAEFYSRHLQRAFLEWREFINDWRSELLRVEEQLGIVLPRVSECSGVELDRFLSEDLKHHNFPNEQIYSDVRVNEWISSSFRALCSLKLDPKSNTCIDSFETIRLQLNSSASIVGPAFAELEQQLFLNAELSVVADKLRAKVSDLTRVLELASVEQDRKTAEINDLRAQVSNLAAKLEEMELAWHRKAIEADGRDARVNELNVALNQAGTERDKKPSETEF